MKRVAWLGWMFIGLLVGCIATSLVLRWTRIDHHAALSANLALQGWAGAVVGAVLGAVVAFAAAVFVLRRTLASDDARFERQRAAEDARFTQQRAAEEERFAEQRAAEDRRLRKQLRESRQQAAAAARQTRRFSIEQKRIEVWGEIVATARGLFWFPVDESALHAIEVKLTSLVLEWEMYTSEGDHETVMGIRRVVSRILGTANRQAAVARAVNATLSPRQQTLALRCEAEDDIAALSEYGVLLHRTDLASQKRGVDWFRAQPV